VNLYFLSDDQIRPVVMNKKVGAYSFTVYDQYILLSQIYL